ncbi:bifunctional DNA primase/polymerase, partial [Candidatus Microgenomates bacterium]|nr:bifunctional DNA primase/polymerase [Candidatus Microgenomates bacterium]
MEMLVNALKYLVKGKSVIPVGKDKKPLIQWQEFQKKLPTEEEVRDWWVQFPTANVGIVTGELSGVTVIDVDVKNGGLETLKSLHLPPTLLVKTGGGGWHYYYKYSPNLKTGTEFYKGIDIRSTGGYVVAPPSIHESGQSYTWANIAEIAEAPDDLFPNKEKTDWTKIVNGVGAGNRNTTATKLFGKLFRAFKIDDWPTVVWGIALQWNNTNTPPINEKELRRTYDSISRLALQDKYQEIEKIEKNEEEKQS